MSQYQLPAFKDDTLFEEFVCDLYNCIERDAKSGKDDYQIFGVKGQKQKGIDILSGKNSTGIQCKVKDLSKRTEAIRQALKDDMTSDLKKTEALNVKLSLIIFTSTFRDDAELQEFAYNLKASMNLNFDVYYCGWDTLTRFAQRYEGILKKYFPHAAPKENDTDKVDFGFDAMPRITTGKELVEIVNSVEGYAMSNDEVETEEEADHLAAFFENLTDYGDLMGMRDFDIGEQIKLGFTWNSDIKRLEDMGFFIFGLRRLQPIPETYGKNLGNWEVANIHVIRKSNPMIVNWNEFMKEVTKDFKTEN